MAERKKYVPGREGGSVDLHRRKTTKDGDLKILPPVVIPPEGLVTDSEDIQKFLDKHDLKGHRNGFIEVDMPGKIAEEEKKKSKKDTPEPNDPAADNEFQALPDDAEFPYHYGGGHWFLSNGERFQGKKEEAVKAEKAMKKHEADAKKAKAEQEKAAESSKKKVDATVVEQVTNLNQLRDWLVENSDIDGRTLTSKEKIENAASELDPPVEFPNYNS